MLVAKRELNDYYEREVEAIVEREKEIRNRKKKKAKSISKLVVITMAVLGFALCLYVLYGYANITKIKSEIAVLEGEKLELEKDKEDLIVQLETIKSAAKIEEDAMFKLGMNYAEDGQLVYLSIDELEENSENDDGNEILFIQEIKNIFNLALDFFRGA